MDIQLFKMSLQKFRIRRNNNSAPDGTSGGYDGLTDKSNLVGKGWIVTTN